MDSTEQDVSEKAEVGPNAQLISSLFAEWMREKKRADANKGFIHQLLNPEMYKRLDKYKPLDKYMCIYSLAVLVADTRQAALVYGRTDRGPNDGILHDMMREVEKEFKREAEAYLAACTKMRPGKVADPSKLITAAIRNTVLKMPLMLVAMVIGPDIFHVVIQSVTADNKYSLAAFPNIQVVSYIAPVLASLKWDLTPDFIHQVVVEATAFILSNKHAPVVMFTGAANEECMFMPVHPSWTVNELPGVAWRKTDNFSVISNQFKKGPMSFWEHLLKNANTESFVDLVQGALSVPADIYYFKDNTIRRMTFAEKKTDTVFVKEIPKSLVFPNDKPTGLSVQSAVISYLNSFGRIRMVYGYYVPASYFTDNTLQSIVPDVVLQSPPESIENVAVATSVLLTHLNVCRFAYMLSRSKGPEVLVYQAGYKSPPESIAICLYLDEMVFGPVLETVTRKAPLPYPMRVKEYVSNRWHTAAINTLAQLRRVDVIISPPSNDCCLAIKCTQLSVPKTDWWASNQNSFEVQRAKSMIDKIIDPDNPPRTKADLVSIMSIIVYMSFLQNKGTDGIDTFAAFRARYIPSIPADVVIDMSG
jgi:hypothetical protein